MAYVSVILIGFCFGRQYNALIQTHFLPLNDPEPYELTAQDFIPAFQISTIKNASSFEIIYNDESLFNITYSIRGP